MKFLFGLAILVALAGSARADDGDKGTFGVGLILGEPTGLSAKLYLDDTHALQFDAASAFVAGGLQVDADYLWHPWILEQRDSFNLIAYVGPGVRALYYEAGRGATGYFALGGRGVIGIVFDFTEVPLDVFAQVAGVVETRFRSDGKFGFGLDAGLGVRYYF